MSLIALDLDGTLIENRWPALGDWLPGAKEAVQRLLDAGHEVYVYTARCHHLWPNGKPRTIEQVNAEFVRVYRLLEDAGFLSISVVAKEPYDLLIDDRAMPAQPWNGEITMMLIGQALRDPALLEED